MIIIDPLQVGGIPPENIAQELGKWLKGYPMCLYCPGDVHLVQKPNIKKLVEEDLPKFLDTDLVRLHHGAREATFLVLYALYKEYCLERKSHSEYVLLDGNTHYSMTLAAERIGLRPMFTETKDTLVVEEDFENKARGIISKEKKPPLAFIVNYPDGKYGNLCDIRKIVDIAHELGSFVVLDGAYSVGRMPISQKKLDIDFVIGSGHKSMATIGPLGVIGVLEDHIDLITKKSKLHPRKELEFLGCSSRGVPTICLMLVMDHLRKRVAQWDEKVLLANKLVGGLEDLGFELQGQKPHKHDLLNFKTDILFDISQRIRDRFFVYRELKSRGIIGVKPGITKVIKLSPYLLNEDQINYLIESFEEIINKYSK